MNIQPLKNTKGVIILVCMIIILTIYAVDIFKLSYRLTAWHPFGALPVEVGEIQSFIADTPLVIGYTEPGSGMISCATTVAYVRSTAQKTYRCCDTGEKISCLEGDFSTDIPASDEKCNSGLQSLFAVPASLENTKDYKLYGNCSSTGTSLTVAQLNNQGQILWKFINADQVSVLSSAMKCILAPLLLVLAVWIAVTALRKREPIGRTSRI